MVLWSLYHFYILATWDYTGAAENTIINGKKNNRKNTKSEQKVYNTIFGGVRPL